MTPERVARLAARWVRLYTAGLPPGVSRRRIDEIESDLHDQIEHDRSVGLPNPRIALRITSRVIRGAAADVAWRGHTNRAARTTSTRRSAMEHVSPARSAVRVGAFVLALLAIPLAGTAFSDEFDWSVADFVLAGILLGIVGVCIDAAIRRRGNLMIAAAVASLGVAAAVLGELDDAPGLVLLGAMLVIGGGAIAYRRNRSATA